MKPAGGGVFERNRADEDSAFDRASRLFIQSSMPSAVEIGALHLWEESTGGNAWIIGKRKNGSVVRVGPLTPSTDISTAAGAAPSTAAYVTIGNVAALSAERALAAGTAISLTDGGANSTATIAFNQAANLSPTGDWSFSTGAISFAAGFTSTAGGTFSTTGAVVVNSPVYLDMTTSEITFGSGAHTGINFKRSAGSPSGTTRYNLQNSGGQLVLAYNAGGSSITQGSVALQTTDFTVDGSVVLGGSGKSVGFFNSAGSTQKGAYTPTNVTTDRSYDANATTVDELADVVGTLIADLQAYGLVS